MDIIEEPLHESLAQVPVRWFKAMRPLAVKPLYTIAGPRETEEVVAWLCPAARRRP